MKRLAAIIAIVSSAIAAPASAAQVFSLSYNTPNGSGQASGGTFNYWDKAYTGSGSTTTDGAALSGGKGDLTDGVLAPALWNSVENGAGTGPYVGWFGSNTPVVSIVFAFSGTPTIDTIKVYADNSLIGGVAQPLNYRVNGNLWAFTPLVPGSFGPVTLTGAPVSGNSLTLTMNYNPQFGAIFVSEVEFFGGTTTSVVPLPAAGWLMLGGLGVLGGLGRRASRGA